MITYFIYFVFLYIIYYRHFTTIAKVYMVNNKILLHIFQQKLVILNELMNSDLFSTNSTSILLHSYISLHKYHLSA